jgi:hypothetical protein
MRLLRAGTPQLSELGNQSRRLPSQFASQETEGFQSRWLVSASLAL